MSDSVSRRPVAHRVDPHRAEAVDVMGPRVQFLTAPEGEGETPCTMRGTIPPGGVVPLHSHGDPETYLAVAGDIEALAETDGALEWIRIAPGEMFHVPGHARHAFRNRSQEPAVMIIVSTARIGRFFQETGTRVDPDAPPSGPPSAEAVRHFLETAERYGYWNAGPEENARVGLALPGGGETEE